jgi:hypothetical protein
VNYVAEVFTSSVVALGRFNPAIFTPDWLEFNRLIGRDDAQGVRESVGKQQLIVSNQVAAFESEWFAIQVLQDKFTLESRGALSPAFKDLVVGIFQLVPHTPITGLGMNFLGHFKMRSADLYHRVGDVLAPKKIWNELYPDETAGLGELQIKIEQGTRERPVETKDVKRIAVKQSGLFKLGIFFSYNDHRDFGGSAEPSMRPAEKAAQLIDREWEASWQDAERVFDAVLAKTLEGDA